VGRIRADWQRGRVTPEGSQELLTTLRTATPAEGSERVVALLNQQVDPACLWTDSFLTAGELLMRQPGIVGLHCVTSINALHFAFKTSSSDETRRMLLLQAAAFLPMFRLTMANRGQLGDQRLDTLERAQVAAQAPQAVEEIFAEVGQNRLLAARKTLGLLEANRDAAPLLMAAARRLIFSKGNDSHDYKFSSASLEDFYHATPAVRNRFLATAMFNFKGAGARDTDLYQRMRECAARVMGATPRVRYSNPAGQRYRIVILHPRPAGSEYLTPRRGNSLLPPFSYHRPPAQPAGNGGAVTSAGCYNQERHAMIRLAAVVFSSVFLASPLSAQDPKVLNLGIVDSLVKDLSPGKQKFVDKEFGEMIHEYTGIKIKILQGGSPFVARKKLRNRRLASGRFSRIRIWPGRKRKIPS